MSVCFGHEGMAWHEQVQKCFSRGVSVDRCRFVFVYRFCNPEYFVLGPLRFCSLHTFTVHQVQSRNHCGVCCRIDRAHSVRTVGLQKAEWLSKFKLTCYPMSAYIGRSGRITGNREVSKFPGEDSSRFRIADNPSGTYVERASHLSKVKNWSPEHFLKGR